MSSVSIDSYTNNSGTSFATPHVTAMAAIAKCIDRNITAPQFITLLSQTSRDLGTAGYDTYYGYGLVDIEAMIDKMLEGTPVFMSPIDDKGENVTVTVYNNSTNPLNAVGIAVEYENGVFFKGADTLNINLSSKETAKISKEKGNIKFMLWDNAHVR